MKLDEIDRFILDKLPQHPHDIVAVTAQHLNVPYTTVRYRLKRFIRAGHIIQKGSRNKVLYRINKGEGNQAKKVRFTYKVGELSEDQIWKNDIKPLLESLPENIMSICSYGFTEMFNNVIDHSKSPIAIVEVKLDSQTLEFLIIDKGIGVFKSIAEHFHIADIRDAVVRLQQGKVTTDKTKHTGQGIYFTSRAFDKFILVANGLAYYKDNSDKDDWYFDRKGATEVGTAVNLKIDLKSTRVLKDIFDLYSNPEDLSFDSSHMRIQLSVYEEDEYVSRSQAKRLLANLGKFKTVSLDFKNIRTVGQAFVDEVFGVFGLENPQISFHITNANDDVKFMIKRGLSDRNFPMERVKIV